MDNYINYAYYDETGKYIAIVHKNTSKETMQRYLEKYDEVKFEENYETRKLDS